MSIPSTICHVRLPELRKGQSGVVIDVQSSFSLPIAAIRRLIELGFVVGERVRILAEAFPYRDPIAVRIGDTNFALRRNEANAIWVIPD